MGSVLSPFPINSPKLNLAPNRRTGSMVSITIVTWNSAQYLDECFAALALLDYPDFEVIIVDNASEDETRARLQAGRNEMASHLQRPQCRLRRRPESGDPRLARRMGAVPESRCRAQSRLRDPACGRRRSSSRRRLALRQTVALGSNCAEAPLGLHPERHLKGHGFHVVDLRARPALSELRRG